MRICVHSCFFDFVHRFVARITFTSWWFGEREHLLPRGSFVLVAERSLTVQLSGCKSTTKSLTVIIDRSLCCTFIYCHSGKARVRQSKAPVVKHKEWPKRSFHLHVARLRGRLALPTGACLFNHTPYHTQPWRTDKDTMSWST